MRKILLWVAVGIVTILAIIVGVSVLQSTLHSRHIKNTASTFVSDILANNATGTYAMFSPTAQKYQTKDSWKAQVNKLSSFFAGKTPKLQSITTTDGKISAVYTITGSDGNYLMTVTLVSSKKAGIQVETFTSLLTVS